ncbi:unnamed protein product [Effrenium voratum]|uniref:Uncharacterized protein n=1 Tax=Effrenium voratum TaxID=2562239 RepID=A0AA36JDB0_9DINO|nr:unnamed protein product [Effrenium voratum]
MVAGGYPVSGCRPDQLQQQQQASTFGTLGPFLSSWTLTQVPRGLHWFATVPSGGYVEIEEFFLGCIRFSGHARAMDVGKIIQDQNWIIKSQGRFQGFVELELRKFREELQFVTNILANRASGIVTSASI